MSRSPLEAPPSGARNVPLPLTQLVDRDHELKRALDLLRRPEIRLVTLTGPAGTGKTRLAIEAALVLNTEFPDGVRFIDLTAVAEAQQVNAVLAEALGFRRPRATATPERSPCERQMLLVLDNFEHVLAAAPALVEALRACPGVKLLVTSRAALRLRGERELPVPPLAVLDPEQAAGDLASAAANPAIALFVACAQSVRPDFALDQDNVGTVAAICARLDGLPLAIELAAARINVMQPEAVLVRLEHRLDLLTGGARDLPPRQQTLRAALTWSYDLLPTEQQRLFRQLSVFESGCTLAAAAVVCAEKQPESQVLEGLAALVDNSLLRVESRAGAEARYRILDTIREFAFERLSGDPEELRETRRRHALHFMAQAESGDDDCAVGSQAAIELVPERDNLRAALRWTVDTGETEVGLRLASRLSPLWRVNGAVAEGRRWLAVLFEGPEPTQPATRGRAMWLAGYLAERDADLEAAARYYHDVLRLARSIGDADLACRALHRLGVVCASRDDVDAAFDLFHEAVERAEKSRWEPIAWPLLHLALAALQLGRTVVAHHAFDTTIQHWQAALARASPSVVAALAVAAIELGEVGRGEALLNRVLTEDASVPRAELVLLLEAVACLAAARGAFERALRLAAAAESVGVAEPLGLAVLTRPLVRRRLDAVRAELRPELVAAMTSAGHALSAEQALATLRQTNAAASEQAAVEPVLRGVEILTGREREVLELLARGARNRDIAAQLVISERTAEWHVANVLSKLELDSRAQLALWFGGRSHGA